MRPPPHVSSGTGSLINVERDFALLWPDAFHRAKVEADAVVDSFAGCVQSGGGNLGRNSALLAGLPQTTSGVTINRFCSSGLNSIAMAARYITDDGANV